MARPDDQVQGWLSDLPFKVKRRLAETIKAEAEGLADAIKSAAPRRTGALAESVRVRRKKNDLQLEVTAGGDSTTSKASRGTDYTREVEVGSGDTAGISKTPLGSGEGVTYDYARAIEFGTVKMAAQPFFYSTYRAREPQIRENIDKAVEEALKS